MSEKQYLEIKAQIEYQENERPSVLFQKLSQSQISLENKVAFVLYRYGWRIDNQQSPTDLEKAQKAHYPIFAAGKQFIKQFDGLIFPSKCLSSNYGSHILTKFIWKPVLMEGVSHHFRDRVIFMGVERLFEGFVENPINCWENILISPDDIDFDFVDLYLGESGKIYWHCYDGDTLGIAANSILEFFSMKFSLTTDSHHLNQLSVWTDSDRKVMRKFKGLYQ